MIILFQTTNKEYFIESNGSTFFVMDDAGQCRLATQSAVKAKNRMNSILSCYNFKNKVSLIDLK